MAGKAKRIKIERGLYQRGPSWEACVTPPGGRKPVWKILGPIDAISRTEAGTLRDEFKVQVKREQYQAPTKTTFGDVGRDWIKTQRQLLALGEIAKNTFSAYEVAARLHVIPHFEERKASSIDGDALVEFHRTLKKNGMKPNTVKGCWTVLGLILKFAVRKKLIASNPMDSLERRERPEAGEARQRFLSRDEKSKLLEKAAGITYLAIAIALFAGLRKGEILGLTWGDVDFERHELRVRLQLDSGERVELKTGNSYREVAMMESLAKLLKRHKLASPWSQPDDLVILDEDGTSPGAYGLLRAVQKAAKAAGIEDVDVHCLRHTYVSMLFDQGRDVTYIAVQAGDTIETILRTYAHLYAAARHAREAREQMDREYGSMLEVADVS